MIHLLAPTIIGAICVSYGIAKSLHAIAQTKQSQPKRDPAPLSAWHPLTLANGDVKKLMGKCHELDHPIALPTPIQLNDIADESSTAKRPEGKAALPAPARSKGKLKVHKPVRAPINREWVAEKRAQGLTIKQCYALYVSQCGDLVPYGSATFYSRVAEFEKDSTSQLEPKGA